MRVRENIPFLSDWPDILILALLCLLIGMLSFGVGLVVPRSWVQYRAFPYRAYGFEKDGNLYRKIGIQRWKTKIPDMSRYVHTMVKKRVTDDRSPAFIERLIQETCIAETTHWVLMLISPIFLYLFTPGAGALYMLLYALGNVPFALVQRYNRPRMLKILDAQEKRSKGR